MMRVAAIPIGAVCLYLLLLLALDLIGVKRWRRGWGFRLRNLALLLMSMAALISFFVRGSVRELVVLVLSISGIVCVFTGLAIEYIRAGSHGG